MQATRMIAVLCALSIAAVPVLATQASADTHIPSGTRATVALRGWLSSADANVGDTFEAALVNDILVEGQLVVPAGSTLVGRVADVERARGMSRGGKLTLVIDRLVSGDGDSTPALATVTGVAEGGELEGKDDKGKRAGIGGAIGGALGAIIGGAAGLLVGLVVGAGGAIAGGRGKDVELPEDTYLLVKFDQQVDVTWTWQPQS